MNFEKIGRIAFYIGLIISLIAGAVNVGYWGLVGLLVLGIIVGALNVTGKEVQRFLVATVALLLVVFTTAPLLGQTIATVLNHFNAFIAGAALLVALREIYSVTKSQ
jgi:hypothetical protein